MTDSDPVPSSASHPTDDDRVFDAVIIGSGAGGGPLAYELSRAGLDVLVLEKGPRFPRRAYDHEKGLQPGQFVPPISAEPHMVVTRRTTEPLATNLGWIATCVGGGTVHMGAYLYRFHPDDFRMASRFGTAAGEDELELADWPIDYAALEPYYCRAEAAVGVSGRAGSDPFEGPRSAPYPLPPLDAHPFADAVEAACERRGLHPFPTPRAIASRPYQGRPACEYCAVCASWGCPVGARGSSQETLIAQAEATGHCQVRPLAMVHRVDIDGHGRASGCRYLDRDGEEHRVRARVVCVATSAIESARLLLMSRSERFPNGLANNAEGNGNGAGRVGRHLQFHGVTMGQARFALDPENGGSPLGELLRDPHPFLGRSVMDHYFLPEGVSDLAKGGLIRFGMAPQVPPGTAGAPAKGLRADEKSRILYFEAFHDFLPNAFTRITLDPEVRDRWGLPVARIHLHVPGHHRRAGQFLAERAFEIFQDLGAVEGAFTDIGGTSSYLVHGTCRMGTDPRESVLDPDCQAHQVPGLYVVDGSAMPTSGGAPPTLTILANSFRVADRLVEQLGGDRGTDRADP